MTESVAAYTVSIEEAAAAFAGFVESRSGGAPPDATFEYDFGPPTGIAKARYAAGEAHPATRASAKHYRGEVEPGIVAASVKVPASVAIRAPVIIGPNVVIPEHSIIRGPVGVIRKTEQILVIGPVGSGRTWLTAIFPEAGGVMVSRGCFTGWLDEFLAEVDARSGITWKNGPGYVYRELARFLESIAEARR